MGTFRRALNTNRGWAIWLIAAALAMRLVVPAGFMPEWTDTGVIIELCSGHTSGQGAERAFVTVPAPGGGGDHRTAPTGKHDAPCAYAANAAPALAGGDPLVLALGIAWVMAVVWRTTAPTVTLPRARLRPPLRGPPAIS